MEQYYLILQSSVQNLNYDLVTDIIKCIVNMTSYTVKTCRTQSLLNGVLKLTCTERKVELNLYISNFIHKKFQVY